MSIRSQHIVEINLDPVAGWGNTSRDHQALLESLLSTTVDHYKPTVKPLLERLVDEGRDLRSEHGENPEYDRALVELIMRVTNMSDEHRHDVMALVGINPDPSTAPEYALSDCANWDTNPQGDCGGRVERLAFDLVLCENCRNR